MADYLVFQLSAALGAMGGYAGNERRGSNQWPARSAINGLIGGALGIDRTDTASIQSLQSSFRIGIAMRSVGAMLTDFHTAQTIPAAVAKRPSSRQQAFAQVTDVNRIMTVLTQREYHQECCFDVALMAAPDASWGLQQIQTALLTPQYVPYFGRKACPLDKPMCPIVVTAPDILLAFEQYQANDAHPHSEKSTADEIVTMLDPDLLPDDHPALESAVRVQSRDQIVDRKHWSFGIGESVRVQQKRQLK